MSVAKLAPIKARLAAFDQDKATLLAYLRDAYNRGPKSKPFDERNSWDDLTYIAALYLRMFYFWRPKIKQDMPAAERIKRLHALAKALGRAHILIDKAMQDEVAYDLFRAWFAGTNLPAASVANKAFLDDNIPDWIRNEIKKAAASLVTLETAAFRAIRDAGPKSGRPKGDSVLPPDCIKGLARLYRKHTGRKSGAGYGEFADFVCAFFKSIGRNLKKDTVVDAIKATRRSISL